MDSLRNPKAATRIRTSTRGNPDKTRNEHISRHTSTNGRGHCLFHAMQESNSAIVCNRNTWSRLVTLFKTRDAHPIQVQPKREPASADVPPRLPSKRRLLRRRTSQHTTSAAPARPPPPPPSLAAFLTSPSGDPTATPLRTLTLFLGEFLFAAFATPPPGFVVCLLGAARGECPPCPASTQHPARVTWIWKLRYGTTVRWSVRTLDTAYL